jgi:hypothetical protein
MIGTAATSAAGDDTTDRAQLHSQIVGELADEVYSPAVLGLRDQLGDFNSVRRNVSETGSAYPSLLG